MGQHAGQRVQNPQSRLARYWAMRTRGSESRLGSRPAGASLSWFLACVHEGVGTDWATEMLLDCMQGEVSRKDDCTEHWPWS